jgi:hypothetical protein
MDCQKSQTAFKIVYRQRDPRKMPDQKLEPKHPGIKPCNPEPQDVVNGEQTENGKGVCSLFISGS